MEKQGVTSEEKETPQGQTKQAAETKPSCGSDLESRMAEAAAKPKADKETAR